MLQVQNQSKKEWSEILPGLPQRVYEELAACSLGVDPSSAEKADLQELRKYLQKKGQTTEEALQKLWGPELGNAPRRLQQTVAGGMAVQEVSSQPSFDTGNCQKETKGHVKHSTVEKLKLYHPPACGEDYKQYSKERGCENMTNKPCESCLMNLDRRLGNVKNS